MPIKRGKKVQRFVKSVDTHVKNEIKRVIKETCELLRDTAKALAPVDEGNLRDSIEYELFNAGFSGLVTVGEDYAIFVEFGTGIYAKGESKAKSIPFRYFSKKLNRWVTSRGIKEQPFWYPALDEASAFFEREMAKI